MRYNHASVMTAIFVICASTSAHAQEMCSSDQGADCRDCTDRCADRCIDRCRDTCRTPDCRVSCPSFCRDFCHAFCRDLSAGPANGTEQCAELGFRATANCLCAVSGLTSPSPLGKGLGAYCVPDCLRGAFETARCYAEQNAPPRGGALPRSSEPPPRGIGAPRSFQR